MRGIHVRCKTCPAVLSDPKFDTKGLTVGEKADFLNKLAARDGWASALTDGNVDFECPACIESRRKKHPANFEPFTAKNICPKCGGSRIATRFCNGIVLTCRVQVPYDHLHRTCGRCGYDWQQQTKDAKESNVTGNSGNTDSTDPVGTEDHRQQSGDGAHRP